MTPNCRRFDWHCTLLACARALFSEGRSRPIRIAMIPTTTMSSIRLKPRIVRDRRIVRSIDMFDLASFRGRAPGGTVQPARIPTLDYAAAAKLLQQPGFYTLSPTVPPCEQHFLL